MSIIFRAGNCLDVFGAEPDDSFDALVSDWPAGVSFMSRKWDGDHGGRDAWVKVWSEVAAMMLRKAKPGAYSLTWALPRTAGWTQTALENGGWFVQDTVVHVFGQGWPKGKAALKPAAEHWILARKPGGSPRLQIDAARVARGGNEHHRSTVKPHVGDGMWGIGKEHGGGFEPTNSPLGSWPPNFCLSHHESCEERGTRKVKGSAPASGPTLTGASSSTARGKFNGTDAAPANYGETESVPAFDCLAGCDCGAAYLHPSGGAPPTCACGRAMFWCCPVAEMDAQSGQSTSTDRPRMNSAAGMGFGGAARDFVGHGHADTGGASRFFPRFIYMAKASGGERHAGCDDLYWRADRRSPFGFVRVSREEWEALPEEPVKTQAQSLEGQRERVRQRGNVHPTVKSLALMQWLVALITPPGGRVGDVTCGSGGTGLAVDALNAERNLGASFLGADLCPEAIEIAEARLRWWRASRVVQAGLFGEATVIRTAEPEKPKPAKPPREKAPAEPQPVDGRQRDLWGSR